MIRAGRELVVAAARAAAILAAHAEATEDRRRPAAPSIEVVRQFDGFALATPTVHSPAGAALKTIARVAVELGRGCASTAWVTAICATTKIAANATLSPEALDVLHAAPDTLLCGSAAPLGTAVEVPDGVRVSGRWPTVSWLIGRRGGARAQCAARAA